MQTSADAKPATPIVKANLDVPQGIKLERQPSGAPSSPRAAGGEVPPEAYRK